MAQANYRMDPRLRPHSGCTAATSQLVIKQQLYTDVQQFNTLTFTLNYKKLQCWWTRGESKIHAEKERSHGSDLSYHNESVTEVWNNNTASLMNTMSTKMVK